MKPFSDFRILSTFGLTRFLIECSQCESSAGCPYEGAVDRDDWPQSAGEKTTIQIQIQIQIQRVKTPSYKLFYLKWSSDQNVSLGDKGVVSK